MVFVFDIFLSGNEARVGDFAAFRTYGFTIKPLFSFSSSDAVGRTEQRNLPFPLTKDGPVRAKGHVVVHGDVFAVSVTMLIKHVLKSHCRHTAASAHYDFLAREIAPIEIWLELSADEKAAVALCQLPEDDGIVLPALLVNIQHGFGASRAMSAAPVTTAVMLRSEPCPFISSIS